MIRVHVRVFGALAKPFGKDDLTFETKENASLESLLLELGYQPSHLRFIVPAVNGAQAKLGQALKDEDEVLLVLPTSGG